ncbi:MAG TPA: DUF2232 domain-containing protein [Turneriella sp.]|nr:DUF2232 domain-containing protein [Turneriella sp.]HNA79362.1 DUF2232 domain-containing protein [Turneriella sp.]HNE20498.1 DUF2232 domain-containing protein [Turneriella sp.]HNL54757.1 DUF2232 domain-containing protein [Turneriella sp.]HNM99833.1 DUF2232 domain-containing protein [Turneriella sp.]
MEAVLGFPLSLAFALIPIYLYRPSFNRRLWLWGVFLLTGLFLLLPGKLRIEAFLPGGAAPFFFIAGVWVVALNPTSSIYKLLNMPLPSRKELKEEIEKVPDVEGRLQKYLALTMQLKKIWLKRDQFLSGYNSAMLLIFSIAATLVSFGVAVYEYFLTGTLKQLLEEIYKQVAARMQASGAEVVDFRPQLLELSPVFFFASSFASVFCLGIFLRIFARLRFKQNLVQGYMSLFRIPDNWVWGLIGFSGIYLLGLKIEALKPATFVVRNGMLILLFLYLLQGIGVASLFFEVRLVPTHWIALGVMLMGLWVPELLTLIALFFTVLGLAEVWFALRKRSLRPVTDA